MKRPRLSVLLFLALVTGYFAHVAVAHYSRETWREQGRERIEYYYRTILPIGGDFESSVAPLRLQFSEHSGTFNANLPSAREDMYELEVQVDKSGRIVSVNVHRAFAMGVSSP
jgi:hypothetical protein